AMLPQLLLRRFPSAGAHRRRYQGHAHRRRLSSSSEVAGGPGWRRQHEEESKAVKVSVWWDFENCHVPQNVNVCRVAQRVSAALRAAGVRGPLSITAFGDVVQLSRAAQEALVATGVVISHVPSSCVLPSHLLFRYTPFSLCDSLLFGGKNVCISLVVLHCCCWFAMHCHAFCVVSRYA
uniref:NYN domain-containing protein n=1 Tax=Aegilops tauschii subsp. strangulata TaxID=200361 RepID=A0A453K9K6_AEGTS